MLLVVYFLSLLVTISISHQQSTNSSHRTQRKQLLLDALADAAGIYKHLDNVDKTAARQLILSKTVLLTISNYKYLNHLHNFKCFLDRLHYKFLLVSLDTIIHDFISEWSTSAKISDNTRYSKIISYRWDNKSLLDSSADYGSKEFAEITSSIKSEVVGQIISLGFNVIFIDIDVILLHDIIPYLVIPNMDYVHGVNWVCPQ